MLGFMLCLIVYDFVVGLFVMVWLELWIYLLWKVELMVGWVDLLFVVVVGY